MLGSRPTPLACATLQLPVSASSGVAALPLAFVAAMISLLLQLSPVSAVERKTVGNKQS